jgi:hypothetical protein
MPFLSRPTLSLFLFVGGGICFKVIRFFPGVEVLKLQDIS